MAMLSVILSIKIEVSDVENLMLLIPFDRRMDLIRSPLLKGSTVLNKLPIEVYRRS